MALPSVNCLSICAGVGGLDLGLQLAHDYRRTPFRGVCFVEIEAAAAASLVASMEAGWFHPAPIWSDARTFDGSAWRGCVDIVTSGDPCQGNSVAGKRRGELDDRWLLDRAIDIFDASGAHTFFRENVPGNADGQLAVAIPALERLGCRIAVGIFSSAETGNTMRRERLFILARRGAGPVLTECAGAWSTPVAGTNGRRGSDREEQRGGEQRLLAQGDGAGRGADRAPELGSANGSGLQGQQRGQHVPAGRQVKSGFARLPGGTILPPAVIPGPADNRGWIDVLDRFPELQPALSEEEAQSHLRRGIDAVANRIERLRATGNGVDPVVAAYAFLSLRSRLAGDRPARANGDVLMEIAA
jgi:DNA (cytosine-5)-methyltransferase 1